MIKYICSICGIEIIDYRQREKICECNWHNCLCSECEDEKERVEIEEFRKASDIVNKRMNKFAINKSKIEGEGEMKKKKEFKFDPKKFHTGHHDTIDIKLPTRPLMEFSIFIDSVKPLELQVGFHRCDYKCFIVDGDNFNELAEKLEDKILKVKYKGNVKRQMEKFIKHLKGDI